MGCQLANATGYSELLLCWCNLPIGNRDKAKGHGRKAKVEGCGRFQASALPLTLSTFALRRKSPKELSE